MLDEDAWTEHRMSVAALITERSPWSRYRVSNCPSIGVCPWGRIAMENRENLRITAELWHEGRRAAQQQIDRSGQGAGRQSDAESPRRARLLAEHARECPCGLTAWEHDAWESYDASCEQPSD